MRHIAQEKIGAVARRGAQQNAYNNKAFYNEAEGTKMLIRSASRCSSTEAE